MTRPDSPLAEAGGRYIPALGYRWLTPLYDPVVRWTTRERAVKAALIEQVRLQPGERALDLACGSATLTIAAKQKTPAADIVGVDGDEGILGQARRKAGQAGVGLSFDRALSHELPYPDGAFDVVMSSLFFHHLTRTAKLATLREVHRVLKPGGRLHIADWGGASNPLMRAAFFLVQLLDGFETTADNVAGRMPALIAEAGFVDVSDRKSVV